jgi:hypothetical protein
MGSAPLDLSHGAPKGLCIHQANGIVALPHSCR